MSRLLLDANLSPETAIHLRSIFGFDVIDLISEGLQGLADPEVVELAKREQRTIVTFDPGFGEIYHVGERGALGIIILRLEDQTVESVSAALTRFFHTGASEIDLTQSLVVLQKDRIRVVRPGPRTDG